MSEIKCPRCSQVFRSEHDPKLGEMLPVGSVGALELAEKMVLENAELREIVKRRNATIEQLQAQICKEGGDCRNVFCLAARDRLSEAQRVIAMIKQSDELRKEAAAILWRDDGNEDD